MHQEIIVCMAYKVSILNVITPMHYHNIKIHSSVHRPKEILYKLANKIYRVSMMRFQGLKCTLPTVISL